jgi:hypothetical protein
VVRRLQETNTPDLALSCPPTEMPLLNGMRPRQLPPGRALLVTRRTATMLQVGWLDPAEPADPTEPPDPTGPPSGPDPTHRASRAAAAPMHVGRRQRS